MRAPVFILLVASSLAVACGNTYHPEYHPQTSVTYSQSVANPVHVTPAAGQGVQVMPAPAQTTVVPAPPAPPTPPEGFPW
jgi:hypothetical protein